MPTTSSVFLNVHDLDKSLEFYRALGFRVANRTERDGRTVYADLSFRGAELGLGAISSNDDAEYRDWVSTPLGAGVVVYFTTTGVDEIFTKAEKAGATIEYPPTDRPYGRVFAMDDPDGYVLNFLQETKRAAKPARRPASPQRTARKKANPGKARKTRARRRA